MKKISLVVLLISISIFFFTKSPQTPISQPVVNRTNYIVRFIQYKQADDHKHYLIHHTSLKSNGSLLWKWIDRNNAAARFPTDFGLVAVDDTVANSVVEEFERLEMVKDVTVDTSYRLRSLLGEMEGKGGGKKPGKIFTKMSFEGEGDVVEAVTVNQTINWRRHVLSQRSQVTSLFGADALWSKGYTGAKVRMAIFDTGIRSDHPHFRSWSI